MPFEYEINGRIVETETELTEQEIDEIAASIRPVPVDTTDYSQAEDFGFVPPTQEELEGTLAFRRGSQEGFTRVGEGIKQVAYGIGEKLGLVTPQEREELNRQIAKDRAAYLADPLSESGWAKTGELVGEVVPTMIIPGGVVGGLTRRIGTSALGGATAAGILPTASGELLDAERAQNITIGAVGGAGTTALLQALPRVVRAGSDFFASPEKKVQKIVGREDLDSQLQNIADDYGIQLTPGEASGLQEVLAVEGGLRTLTDEAATQLGRFVRGRMGKLDAQTNDFMKAIIKDEPVVAERIAQGYRELERVKLKPKALDSLFNAKITDANTGRVVNVGQIGRSQLEKFRRSADWKLQLETIPKNSVAEFDMFKKFLDEQQDKLFNAGKKNASRNIKQFKDVMLKGIDEEGNKVLGLDQLVPSYEGTRKLSQLSIVKQSLNKSLDEIPTKQLAIGKSGQTLDVTDPITFYQRNFKKESDFNELKRKLSSSPQAIEKLTKLREVMKAVERSPLQRMIAGTGEEIPQPAGGGAFGGAAGAAVFSGLDLFTKKRSEQMIKYITNEKWDANLLDSVDPTALQKGSAQAYDQLVKALSRVSAVGTVPEPRTPELTGQQ